MQTNQLSTQAINEISIIVNRINESAVDAEIVDTGADIIEVVQIAEGELGDGFDWDDIFGLIPAQPIVTELLRDTMKAVTGITFMLPNEAPGTALMIRDEARRRRPLGKVSTQIARFFYWAATTYDTGDQILNLVNAQKDRSIAFIKNLPLFPDEIAGASGGPFV